MLQAGEFFQQLLRGRLSVKQALVLSASAGKNLVTYHVTAAEVTI